MKNKRSKPTESWRHIPVPPFRCGVCIFIGTPSACVKHLRKLGYPDVVDAARLRSRIKESLAVTICMPNGESCIYSTHDIEPGALVHELCHAVAHMLEYKEITEVQPNNEVFAYTLEYLYEEATK